MENLQAEDSPPSVNNASDFRLSSVRFRGLTAFDRHSQKTYFNNLSFASRQARFMCTIQSIPESLLDLLSSIDGKRHVAFMAEALVDGVYKMIAEARFVVDDDQPDTCEFAISVDDYWQSYGLGSSLLTKLERKAFSMGIKTMAGDTLNDNSNMINLARRCGFTVGRNHRDASAYILSKTSSTSLKVMEGGWSSSLKLAA